jgi:hypothetical protein
MPLKVVSKTNARIRHDRRTAAGLDRVGSAAVSTGAVELVAVEGMATRELMAHFMGYIVNRIEIADRSRDAGAASRFIRTTDDAEIGPSARWPMS